MNLARSNRLSAIHRSGRAVEAARPTPPTPPTQPTPEVVAARRSIVGVWRYWRGTSCSRHTAGHRLYRRNDNEGRQLLSEYQYYEFQAIDRPLNETDRQALRAMSTRARITATSFANEYHWGSLKGSPGRMMERWFDLHLYLANWGTRRLMIRLPQRLVARPRLDRLLHNVEIARVSESGENLIVDIQYDGEPHYTDQDDDTDCLAAMAPLRTDVLAGDWRLFYLLWLTEVESGRLDNGDTEPLRGIGPLTGALKAFADLFSIDPDLVQAAAESSLHGNGAGLSDATVRATVAAIPEREKVELLCRLVSGDPHVAGEVGCRVREAAAAAAGEAAAGRRTVADLRTRAAEIRNQREVAAAERREAERRSRLATVRQRGVAVWREVETEVQKRQANGYDRALALLLELRALAQEDDTMAAFSDRVRSLRDRHSRKLRFIERLRELDRQ